MMKLWLITPKDDLDPKNDPWAIVYDCYHGFVIAADDEQEARKLAHERGADEKRANRNAWLSAKYSDCVELVAGDTSGIILSDFHAG